MSKARRLYFAEEPTGDDLLDSTRYLIEGMAIAELRRREELFAEVLLSAEGACSVPLPRPSHGFLWAGRREILEVSAEAARSWSPTAGES